MDICIDFDGTCVTHDFPVVGRNIGAAPVLQRIVKNGHRLILFTMRSDNGEKDYLQRAVNWFSENDIPLYGIQRNPTQHEWTTSPKAYCQLYIDDAALGCPIILDTRISDRPFVDWRSVEKLLESAGILRKEQ